MNTHWSSSNRATALRASKGRSLIALLLGTMIVPAVAGAQFSAQPVILGLAPVDSAVSGVVTVRNEGQQPMQFRFRMGDFDQTISGDHVFQPFGAGGSTCQGRVSVYPEQATLLPGEVQQVRVTMQPGARTCWGVLFAEQRARNTTGIMIGQQIAVKVYGTRPELTLKGEVTRVAVSSDSLGARIAFDFRNSGEGPLRPSGTIEIRTPTGDVVATESVDAYSVLPGHTRRVTVGIGARLKAGRYVAVPIMDFGADYLAGGQASLAIP
jgi:hypothetical protein